MAFYQPDHAVKTSTGCKRRGQWITGRERPLGDPIRAHVTAGTSKAEDADRSTQIRGGHCKPSGPGKPRQLPLTKRVSAALTVKLTHVHILLIRHIRSFSTERTRYWQKSRQKLHQHETQKVFFHDSFQRHSSTIWHYGTVP